MTQTIDLSVTLLERAAAIARLNAHKLSLDWLRETPIPRLISCCERMDTELPGVYVADKKLQAELIQNPAFAAYYAKLLPMFPEEPPAEPRQEPVRNTYGRYYQPTPRPAPPSRRSVLMSRLCDVLEACQTHDRDITAYPHEQLMTALEIDPLPDNTRLVYLENFGPELSDEARQTVVNSFQYCHGIPLELTKQQKSLLLEPFTAQQHLFASAPFSEVADLLNVCPELLNIIRLLYDRHIHEELDLTHYNGFAQDAAEYHRLLTTLLDRLGTDAASAFMEHWRQNGCPLHELRTMLRRTADGPGLDWVELLSTNSGYVNQLYGARFKQIDLAHVSAYQEDVLIYAIVHNKKHFIRLVDEQAETFLALPKTSILFQDKLYREHFNLNELTAKDLKDCAWMAQRRLSTESLSPGRRYTFPELRELYDLPGPYMTLYHLLRSGSQDYRLKVLRQARKRDVLRSGVEDAELADLAANLDVKPLDVWMQTDFGHISGLTHSDAAQMLANLDRLRHLLPYMANKTDALLALRCLDKLEQYNSIMELKEDLLQTDADWHTLLDCMDLTPEFQRQHRESIIRFLCNNGAFIAEMYRGNSMTGNKRRFFAWSRPS